MTKNELIEAARALNITVHTSWSRDEIRTLVLEKRKEITGTSQIPKGLASMTKADLEKKMDELKIPVPPAATKGHMMRLTRDTTADLSEQVCTFGRHRGLMFKEIPESYLLWSVKGVQAKRSGSSEELRQLANYAERRMEKSHKMQHYDPEENAAIPYSPDPNDLVSVAPSAAMSSTGTWSMVPPAANESPEKRSLGKTNRGKGYVPPKIDSLKRASDKEAGQTKMEQDIPEEVKAEFAALSTRLASLKDKYGV
ncbi:unnamed protein product [Symbiodinium pilosum]|uniref:Uncharacterized protein n=1 Tax=Symbiodinium pilosum TaxID=2952 RepID=A0A812UL32_SYMPI|nr:unnamed protein product [Symbiodinium pilosum]